ncbi:hypothetical protein [Citrobacter youngae]|uniref:hypothetical protein n=1 Tax=Citrobacter youngae TaxID=133448 RepID=UPI00397934E2
MSLQQYERPERIFTLLIGLIVVYTPIGTVVWYITKGKKIKIKEIVMIALFSVSVLVYSTTMFASGIFIKLNDYSMSYAGLRDNNYHWIKINPGDFPDSWLDNYKGIKKPLAMGKYGCKAIHYFKTKIMLLFAHKKQ